MRCRVRHITISLVLPMLLAATATAQASTDPELRRLLKEAVESDYGFHDRFDAQVWLLDMSNRLQRFVDDPKDRIELLKQVHYEARRVDIEPELVLAVIEVESRFDEFAISVSGARGLMQVMPGSRKSVSPTRTCSRCAPICAWVAPSCVITSTWSPTISAARWHVITAVSAPLSMPTR